jgi:multiple sugar transport system ATP-binding protein
MDEPLSNLDAKLRVSTRTQIAELQSRLGVTTLYVTHDQVEAMTMGDRVAVIKDGVLQQVDVPRALYDAPVNSFVAGFIGSPAMNLLDATIVENGVQIGRTVVSLPRSFQQVVGKGPVTVGLRPEALELASDDNGISAIVKLVEELGSEAYIYAQMADQGGETTSGPEIVVRVAPTVVVKSGDRIDLRVKDDSMLLFDAESGVRIKGQ